MTWQPASARMAETPSWARTSYGNPCKSTVGLPSIDPLSSYAISSCPALTRFNIFLIVSRVQIEARQSARSGTRKLPNTFIGAGLGSMLPPGPAVKLECCIEPFAVCEKACSAVLPCHFTPFDAYGQPRDRRFAIPINVIRMQC